MIKAVTAVVLVVIALFGLWTDIQSASQLAESTVTGALPPNSVYHLGVTVEDQFGKVDKLSRYRGRPTLVAMFYASCPHVCPMIISTIQLTESKLSADERDELRILMISIDPERDTPDVLLDVTQRHSVDANRWSMVRPQPGDVRAVAGVFGVKYKQLPDGDFSHTSKIILLDRDGTQIASTDRLGRHDPEFLEAITAALR